MQNDGLDFLKVLSNDHIDAIRINTVESIMFHVYDQKTFNNFIWPLLKPLFEDPCWRVKYACILQIGDVREFLKIALRFANRLGGKIQRG